VDDTGRAYAPAALRGPDGWRVDLALLYDPADPSAGLLRAEWSNFSGFDRLRPVGFAWPPGSALEYSVQPGDTLSGLANRLGLDIEAVRRGNPAADPAKLRVGEKLVLRKP
jgi:hypothetical protein